MSCLDKTVSYYPSINKTYMGVDCNLLALLRSNKHKIVIQALRSEPNPVKQKALKENLPCYTVAGTFSRRCDSGLLMPSGLAAIDLDSAEEYDTIDLVNELKKLEYIAYAGHSCRGQRLFCIVQFMYPEQYKKQYDRLIQSFIDLGFPMGDDCHKKISQPRFVSYNDDTTQFFNHNAKPFHLLPPEKTFHVFKHKIHFQKPTNKFEQAKQILEKQSNYFADGNKHNYLFNLCRLLNKMGVTQGEAEDYISSFFPLNQIKSNCITHPYKCYSNEFNSWESNNPNATSI